MSLGLKLDLFNRLNQEGVPIDTTVFAQASDSHDPAVCRVADAAELLRDDRFQTADLHIFEFGIHYPLFDCIFLVPPGQLRIGIFHNVTPPELGESPEQQSLLWSSMQQRSNLFETDRVLCDSEFNRDALLTLGLDPDLVSVLHLPPGLAPRPRPSATSDVIELLYVGRFLGSKGLLDLMDAVEELTEGGICDIRVTLAGNIALSSPGYVNQLRERLRHEPLGSIVGLVETPTDDELADLYARCDVFVMPSHHEGYCLPVIEALAAGCQVVASDAGNLPNVVGKVGTLVSCGDVEALGQAIKAVVESIRSGRSGRGSHEVTVAGRTIGEGEWRDAVRRHLSHHSRAGYDDRMLDLVRWAAERRSNAAFASILSRARQARGMGREV